MRIDAAILAVATMLLQATNAVQACGDKFLLVGRGVEFHRAYAALYPASIVTMRGCQHVAKAIHDSRFQRVWRRDTVFCSSRTTRHWRRTETDRVDLILPTSPML
jgi:hypothetical protein